MSIALWRLNYVQSVALNTPSEAKKALGGFVYKKLFFAERVAVLRSLTATLDRERSEVFTERKCRDRSV